MRMLAFQIEQELFGSLRQALREIESNVPLDAPRPTMRALCTALLVDGLASRKHRDLVRLATGQEVRRGRKALPPEVQAKLEAQGGKATPKELADISAYSQRTGNIKINLAQWRAGKYKE